MLTLIFNKEANIKEALVEAFRRLYTNIPSQTKNGNYYVAKNLIRYYNSSWNNVPLTLSSSLTFKANLGELTALEELITELTKNKHITPGVIQALWDIFGTYLFILLLYCLCMLICLLQHWKSHPSIMKIAEAPWSYWQWLQLPIQRSWGLNSILWSTLDLDQDGR